MKFGAALGALALGASTAGSAVVLHDIAWAVVLAWLATLLTARALVVGLGGRVPYAVGWMAVLAFSISRTSGGGYLVASTTSGYVVMALGLLVMSVAIATYPLKRRRRLAGHDQSTGNPNDLSG